MRKIRKGERRDGSVCNKLLKLRSGMMLMVMKQLLKLLMMKPLFVLLKMQ